MGATDTNRLRVQAMDLLINALDSSTTLGAVEFGGSGDPAVPSADVVFPAEPVGANAAAMKSALDTTIQADEAAPTTTPRSTRAGRPTPARRRGSSSPTVGTTSAIRGHAPEPGAPGPDADVRDRVQSRPHGPGGPGSAGEDRCRHGRQVLPAARRQRPAGGHEQHRDQPDLPVAAEDVHRRPGAGQGQDAHGEPAKPAKSAQIALSWPSPLDKFKISGIGSSAAATWWRARRRSASSRSRSRRARRSPS